MARAFVYFDDANGSIFIMYTNNNHPTEHIQQLSSSSAQKRSYILISSLFLHHTIQLLLYEKLIYAKLEPFS